VANQNLEKERQIEASKFMLGAGAKQKKKKPSWDELRARILTWGAALKPPPAKN